MYPQVSFGAWLQKRRKIIDLTQAELAQCAGCSISALRKIEADERRPSKQLAGLLADCLEIPPEDKSSFIKIARGEMLLERLHIADSFPSINTLLDPQSSLEWSKVPIPATPLVGREPELTTIGQLFSDPQCRLLTVAGLGGMGKTRLALEAALQNQAEFPDGICFISLAPLHSSERIIPTIAGALGFKTSSTHDLRQQLFTFLREKRSLLILDNFEHLLDGVDILVELLQQAPYIQLLVTTRYHLNLQGEWVMEIHGLPVPDPGHPDQAHQYSAFQLFVQSAKRTRADFAIAPDERIWVIKICQLLQGMPLGIELAAAWAHTLTCREIAQEIERDLDFLSSRMRDIPERHRSLRTVLDHSWGCLSDQERQVLRRLAVFRGGFNRQAAEQLAGADLVTLSTLLDRSLLQRSTSGRYDLHELVRHYAAGKLQQAGELELIYKQYLEYYLELAKAAELEFEGPHLDAYRDRINQEGDNLRAALEWALDHDTELGLQLVGSISVMHEDIWLLGTEQERRQWLKKAIQAADSSPQPVSPGARAKVLLRAAILEPQSNVSKNLLEESVVLARQADDKRTLAYALSIASSYEFKEYHLDLGEAYFQESLSIFQELGSKFGVAHVYMTRGVVERLLGNYQRSIDLCESSLALAKELGHNHLAAIDIANLTALAIRIGDLPCARKYLDECQQHYLQVHNDLGMGDVLFQRARIALIEGEYKNALGFIDQSLAIACERDHAALKCGNYLLLGDAFYYQDELDRALEHYNTALELVETAVGFGPPWVMKLLILIGVSEVSRVKGDFDLAMEIVEQVLHLLEKSGDAWSHALAYYTLGRVELSRRHPTGAQDYLLTSLSEMQKIGDQLGFIKCLESLAMAAAVTGGGDSSADSLRLFAAAETLRRSLNFPIPPVEFDEYQSCLTDARSRLSEADNVRCWSEGQSLVAAGSEAVMDYLHSSQRNAEMLL